MTSKYYFNGNCCYNLEQVSFIQQDLNDKSVHMFISINQYTIKCQTVEETQELYRQIIKLMIDYEKEQKAIDQKEA